MEKSTDLKFNAFLIIVFLVLFPVVLSWEHLSLEDNFCPVPSFAIVPQDLRRTGSKYDLAGLDYVQNSEDLADITFNSLLVIKMGISASMFQKITLHAELNLINSDVSTKLKPQAEFFSKSHDFKTKSFIGPFPEREVYFKIDFNSARTPVLPGKYSLKLFSIIQEGISTGKPSTSHEYAINIQKDKLFFYPQYSEDPRISNRRGSIYSIFNSEDLTYTNAFKAIVRDSLMTPVSGDVSLYLVDRDKATFTFKKLIDQNVGEDGLISYDIKTHIHFGTYMRGKMVYDGEQSLFYETTSHMEDCEITTNKFVNTNHDDSTNNEIYNGTVQEYNKNNFKVKNHLFYLQEFSAFEPQWIKTPGFSFFSQEPEFLYYDIQKSSQVSIESPLITYLGTRANYAYLEYKYQLYSFDSLNNEIWVDLMSQVIRDGEVVHEQIDYQGFYNGEGGKWQLVNLNLSQYFGEGGQQFKIKIKANFTYISGCNEKISLRFDYVKLEAFHPSTYYRGFDFNTGLNEFAASIESDSEVYFWDNNYPIRVGGEILSSNNISEDVNRNGFGIFAPLEPEKRFFSSEFLINHRLNLKDLEVLQDNSLVSSDLNYIDLEIDFDAFYFSTTQSKPVGSPILGSLTCEMMIMVESSENIDLELSNELLYDDWKGDYELKDLYLSNLLSISSNELLLELDENTFRINTINQDQLFHLSNDEKKVLLSKIGEIYNQNLEEVFIVFKFKLQALNPAYSGSNSGLNLWVNHILLAIQWENASGCQFQTYSVDKCKDPFLFFEKRTTEAELNLLTDFNIELDQREDFAVFSSYSPGYYSNNLEENIQYFLPANTSEELGSSFISQVNSSIDCIGYRDLIDGPNSIGRTGLKSPNLRTEEIGNYSVKTILRIYPFFSFQEGSNDKTLINYLKSESINLDLEIFNEFNEKISSANTIATIPMNSFKIDDFILLSNDKGERYYVLKDHLTLYLYLDGVITSTDYIYAKLSSEFMNSFHTTDSKIFKSHYGILLDDLKLEFIEQDIVLEVHDLVSNATENIFPFISNSPLYIEDFPSFINNMSINDHPFEETTYFNDHANLSLSLNNNDDINLVKIHVNKIIADNLVMTGYSKNPENQQEPYLDPNRHIYSFFDDYTLNGTFYYENVLYWQDQAIPFKDLNILRIEEIVTEQGISIPFIFDPITKEIKFSERYGSFLNESTILHLKGVS